MPGTTGTSHPCMRLPPRAKWTFALVSVWCVCGVCVVCVCVCLCVCVCVSVCVWGMCDVCVSVWMYV